jgi:hypothetical protein
VNRKQFLEYASYFNQKKFDKVVSYFCPDFMDPQIPGLTGNTVQGPKEFIAKYEALTANVREVLNVGVFISRGRHFYVELVTEFHVFRDPPSDSNRTWKKGDVSVLNQVVLYDLDEKGKFKRIRIFHGRHLDPATVLNK